MRVIDGAEVWSLHATHGFPIDVSIPMLADRGYVPAWTQLLAAAEQDGANMPRLIDRLIMAVRDGYEPAVARVIAERLGQLGGR